jgi:hypothetical protein
MWPARLSCALSVFAATVYAALGSAHPRWGDATDLARRAVTQPLAPYARAYPLQSGLVDAVSHLVDEPARAATLVTAAIAGMGVGLVHWICRRLLGCGEVAALGAAGAWAVHHTIWTSAVDGDAYALLGVGCLLACGAVLATEGTARGAWACGLVVGVLALHHRASWFLAPVIVAAPVVLAQRGRRRAAIGSVTLAVLCGLVPFVALVVAQAAREDGWNATFLSKVLVGTPRNAELLLASERPVLPSLAYVGRWTLFALPGAAIPLALWGWFGSRRERPRRTWLLTALVAVALVLPLRFDAVGDRYVFLLAAHPALILFAGVGLQRIVTAGREPLARGLAVSCIAVPVACYACLAGTGARLLPGLTTPAARDFFLPLRLGDPGSSDWASWVAGHVDAEAVVHADWGAGAALDYAHAVHGVRVGSGVVRRGPSPHELASGAPRVFAVTPIWNDTVEHLPVPVDAVERVGRGLYRLAPPR